MSVFDRALDVQEIENQDVITVDSILGVWA